MNCLGKTYATKLIERSRNRSYRTKKLRIVLLCVLLAIIIVGSNILYKNEFKKVKASTVITNTEKLVPSKILKVEKAPVKAEAVPLYKDIYKEDGIKTAYLTFDDGPSISTPKLLKVLDKYNIKATFFILGKFAVTNKEVLKELKEDGHAIGSHGYSHEYNKIYASLDNFKEDFRLGDEALKEALGQDFNTKIYRFPGGSFEIYKNPYKDYLHEIGDTFIDWNALNGDAEGKHLSSKGLFERAKITIAEKQHVIVLMHDAANKSSTVEALPKIIEYLKDKGYIFKTL